MSPLAGTKHTYVRLAIIINLLLSNLSTDFAAALCDPIAYHQESEKRQAQLKSLQLDDEEAEEVVSLNVSLKLKNNSLSLKKGNHDLWLCLGTGS